jgi:hypothetical protein
MAQQPQRRDQGGTDGRTGEDGRDARPESQAIRDREPAEHGDREGQVRTEQDGDDVARAGVAIGLRNGLDASGLDPTGAVGAGGADGVDVGLGGSHGQYLTKRRNRLVALAAVGGCWVDVTILPYGFAIPSVR